VRARKVCRWLRYADYVAAWAMVPPVVRPFYRVMLVDGVWVPLRAGGTT
jgi:hypothetical protein